MIRLPEALPSLQHRLGYRFKKLDWLILALTHSTECGENNQRLEFLGDAILGAVISKKLFEDHPTWDEGDLSVARTALVCKDHLASVARSLALGEALIIRKDVAKSGPVHAMPAVLADALEAMIGAIFLDGGYQAAYETACTLIVPHEREGSLVVAHQTQDVHPSKDAKTRLQEWLQAKNLPLPSYLLVKTEGLPNNCIFFVECILTKPALSSHGEGRSRKSAEQDAANNVLQQILRDPSA